MKGWSHILTVQDCEKLNYGKAGMCVDLVLTDLSSCSHEGFTGAVLQYPITLLSANNIRPTLYFRSLESKVLFNVKPLSSVYGVYYEYDSTLSQIAAPIENYNSEIFTGKGRSPEVLEEMAKAVLEKTDIKEAAINWILLDEAPIGCKSLSNFLLDIAHRN